MQIKKTVLYLASIVLCGCTVAVGVCVWHDKKYLIISLTIALFALICFYADFEHSRPSPGRLAVTALFSAFAAISRAVFYLLPSVKPMAAIVILFGAGFGPGQGFLCGSMAAGVSNFLFGQGPWTPWQMLGTGLCGFVSGLVFHREKKVRPIFTALFGFFSIMLIYGPLLDLSSVFFFSSGSDITFMVALSYLAAGVPFNLTYAISTAVFSGLLCTPLMRICHRTDW